MLLLGGQGAAEPYPGYDWYVDSAAGNDANSGAHSYAAFATLAAVMAVAQAGDRIGWKKGSLWREMFVPPANNIVVEAYGAIGAKPIAAADDVIANASFTKTAGRTNVYQATVPIDYADTTIYVNAFENDAFLTRAADLATCDSTPGTYFPSAENTSPITLYIHPAGSGNPITNGKTYEYTRRWAGVHAYERSGCTFTGIRTRRNLMRNGSLVLGVNNAATDCDAWEGNYHNVFARAGCSMTRVHAYDSHMPGFIATLFVHFEDGVAGDVSYDQCVAEMPVYNDSVWGFFGHAVNATWGDVLYTECGTINCERGICPENATTLTIQGGDDTGGKYPIWNYNPALVVNDRTTRDLQPNAHAISCHSGTVSVSLDGNDLESPTLGVYINTPNVELTAINNTYADPGDGGGSSAVVLNSTTTYYSRGNVFLTKGFAYIQFVAGATVIDSDLNAYHDSAAGRFWNGSTNLTSAEWVALGYDLNATFL